MVNRVKQIIGSNRAILVYVQTIDYFILSTVSVNLLAINGKSFKGGKFYGFYMIRIVLCLQIFEV